MDIDNYVKRVFESKKQFHKQQANLPIEEKIKILIKLQEIAIIAGKNRSTDSDKIIWKV